MIVLLRGCGYPIHEQLQIGPHDDVGVQFDLVGWTLSLCKELVQSLKSHPSLGLRPLVDGC